MTKNFDRDKQNPNLWIWLRLGFVPKCKNRSRQRDTLPQPGGPQSIIDETLADSSNDLSGRCEPTMWPCPTKSDSTVGRIRSASGVHAGNDECCDEDFTAHIFGTASTTDLDSLTTPAAQTGGRGDKTSAENLLHAFSCGIFSTSTSECVTDWPKGGDFMELLPALVFGWSDFCAPVKKPIRFADFVLRFNIFSAPENISDDGECPNPEHELPVCVFCAECKLKVDGPAVERATLADDVCLVFTTDTVKSHSSELLQLVERTGKIESLVWSTRGLFRSDHAPISTSSISSRHRSACVPITDFGKQRPHIGHSTVSISHQTHYCTFVLHLANLSNMFTKKIAETAKHNVNMHEVFNRN